MSRHSGIHCRPLSGFDQARIGRAVGGSEKLTVRPELRDCWDQSRVWRSQL